MGIAFIDHELGIFKFLLCCKCNVYFWGHCDS
jgi:hypothetical protein